MELNVLYFAHVRAVVGRDRETLAVPAGSTVDDVVAQLVAAYPALGPLVGAVRFAVDGEFVSGDRVVGDGAEFVLIPPVAGGAGTTPAAIGPVAIGSDVLDAARRAALEALVMTDRDGALCHFAGIVRNHARGRAVTRLFYEAYPAMALTQLQRIVDEVQSAFPQTRVAVHHRTGMLQVGDTAVIVVAASPHRAEAFDACRRVIDRLKQDVPIWKREIGPDGSEWVSDRP